MAHEMVRGRGRPDEFARMHRLFVHHYGIALGLVWLGSAAAALQAPWLRNIRGLIDPAGRAESTFSFLFGLPILMTAGWLCVAFGGEVMRRSQLLRNQTVEFGLAGLVAFAVFCLAIQRVATVIALGS